MSLKPACFPVLAFLLFFFLGCGSTGVQSMGDSASWIFQEVSGNWTVAFPRSERTTRVYSEGTLDCMVESVDIDERRVEFENTIELSDEELAMLADLKSVLDLSSQGSLDIAGECCGGGAGIYTYAKEGAEENEFTVNGGCDAELSDTDAKLAAFIDAIHNLTEACFEPGA